MRPFLLSLLAITLVFQARAQDKPLVKIDTLYVPKGYMVILEDTSFVVGNDTVVIGRKVRMKEDPYAKSQKFYDSLEERADRTRVTKELHELLIRKQRRAQTVDSAIIKSEDSFKKFEGMTVRSIRFKKIDLLEGSVLDTVLEASSRVGKWVNRLHADTRPFIIRNNLLFDVGDKVDPYKFADNERVLRQFKTIRDARIYLAPVDGSPNEVDVVVVTQDVASVGASGSYSSLNKFSLSVYDINILGYAKQLQVSYFRNTDGSPQDGYEILLREPNISGSFVSGEIKYTDNYLRNRMSITAGRDFLTPKMKYAGGLEVFKTHENYVINRNDTLPQPYTQESLDLWLARSVQLATRTNFIVAARTYDYRFTSRPFISPDSNYFFFNRNYILGGLTIFKTNYIKGSLIQGFGRTEDVPVNAWFGTTFGSEYNDYSTRPYLDAHGGMGRYMRKSGYFYADFTVGGFKNGSVIEDGIVSFSGRYFSNLLPAGKTRVRQFVNVSYVRGYNRTIYQTLAINRGWRDVHGFVPLGTERALLGIETVYFTPWYFYGFKFAIYHGADFNVLSDNGEKMLDKKNVFPSIKAGIRMLNDNLVFPTLSVDARYYIRTADFKPAFTIEVSTTLPRLFGAPQSFKPQIAAFQ
ncbi:MAG TPA: hypothetical protein VFE50_21155 [Cyclobacteriaceae bacterium]|nr:hypothetical protein [Cyclobacteriaceae bacterium]